MSYWAHLECACCGRPLSVERHSEGGTYALGGTDEAELNVTYNYSAELHRAWQAAGGVFDGEGDGTLGQMLGTKRAGDVLEALDRAVAVLGTERDGDYWKPTEGNAGFALSILRDWARQHPNGVFRIS